MESAIATSRQLRSGDVDAIVDLHRRVFQTEYGAGDDWIETTRVTIEQTVQRGWPQEHALGSVWLVEQRQTVAGSLALVLDCPRVGNIDWFVLTPELRGRGLGRHLVSELVAEARSRRMDKLKVHTFSALTTRRSAMRS